MVGAYDEDAGSVKVLPPTKCGLQMFYHFARRHSIPSAMNRNPGNCNQWFMCKHAAAKHVDKHFYASRNAHCKSHTLTRPGGLTAIRNRKTPFLANNSCGCSRIPQRNSLCETFRGCVISFTRGVLYLTAVCCHRR